MDEPPPEGVCPRDARSLRVSDDARRNDHRRRPVLTAGGGDPPAAVVPPHRGDGATRCDGQAERLGVAAQVVAEQRAGHEQRVGAREPQTRQARQVLAGVECETVVQIRPAVPDRIAAFEHDVGDAAGRELL